MGKTGGGKVTGAACRGVSLKYPWLHLNKHQALLRNDLHFIFFITLTAKLAAGL
jgi:hypothetical protein